VPLPERPSPGRVPVDDEVEIERLYRTHYRGFNILHFQEHLVPDHLCRWRCTWTMLFPPSKGQPKRIIAGGLAGLRTAELIRRQKGLRLWQSRKSDRWIADRYISR
jgi:hypothetical protein